MLRINRHVIAAVTLLTGLVGPSCSVGAGSVTNAKTGADALRCQLELRHIELPATLETSTGMISRDDALRFLDSSFGISTVADLAAFTSTAAEFKKLLAPGVLTQESVSRLVLTSEFQCLLPDIPADARTLLEQAQLATLYRFGRIDPNNDVVIAGLEYSLLKLAILQGPLPGHESGTVAVPDKEHLRRWISRARQLTPTLRTCGQEVAQQSSEDCLVFGDDSTLDDPDADQPASPPVLSLAPTCVEQDHIVWSEQGMVVRTFGAPSILRLDIELIDPVASPSYDLVLADAARAQPPALVRTLNAPFPAASVIVPVAGSYRLSLDRLPVDRARVCWSEVAAQAAGTTSAQTDVPVSLKPRGLALYTFQALSTDDVTIDVIGRVDTTGYYVTADFARTPPFPPASGPASPRSFAVPLTYQADPLRPGAQPTARLFTIALGHFSPGTIRDARSCATHQTCRYASFLEDPAPATSAALLRLRRQSTLKAYYVGRATELTWSSDEEPRGLGEGEARTHTAAQLLDGSKPAQTVLSQQFDFPYTNYREIEDYGEPYDSQPTVAANVPVLAVPSSALAGLKYANVTLTSYEDDDYLFELLNPVTWYRIADEFAKAVKSAVACANGDPSACFAAICSMLQGIGDVGKTIASEDDPLGAPSGNFEALNPLDRNSRFGLQPGQTLRSFTMQGSSDKLKNVWQNLKDLGDKCDVVVNGDNVDRAKFVLSLLSGAEDDTPWAKAGYEVAEYNVQPTLGSIGVTWDAVRVADDRDGFGKGDGDLYANTFVGTVGDPSGQTQGGNVLPPEILKDLPFADASTVRLPARGFQQVGDGDTWTTATPLFGRAFASRQFVAGLYVQIQVFDSDSFEDDEVGLVSDWYPYPTLQGWIETCTAGGAPGVTRQPDGSCRITRTTDVLTREIQNDRGRGGITGQPGATFTYTITLTAPPA